MGTRTFREKEEWPEHKVPAKFEQGGFTSRRRKDPKTLFPGTSPENSLRGNSTRENLPRLPSLDANMVPRRALDQPEFVLPRLQKKQCYQIVSIWRCPATANS